MRLFASLVLLVALASPALAGFTITPAPAESYAFTIREEKPAVQPSDRLDYSQGIPREEYRQLASQKLPVFIWVAYKCPSSAKQVSGVHRHVDDYLGITKPCVVVLKPRGDGVSLDRERIIDAKDCCASSLANAPPAFSAPRGGG